MILELLCVTLPRAGRNDDKHCATVEIRQQVVIFAVFFVFLN